jgi:hypothetical protein
MTAKFFYYLLIRLTTFLLLVTATAKILTLLTDAYADLKLGVSVEVLWSVAIAELALVAMNLRHRSLPELLCINLVVFCAFWCFAFSRWLLGYGSCGCTGNIEVPSWFFACVDSAIVLAILVPAAGRSMFFDGWESLKKRWQACDAGTRGSIFGIAIFTLVIGILQFPALKPIKESLSGSPSVVVAEASMLSGLDVGKTEVGEITLTNHSSVDGRIVGVGVSCGCVSVPSIEGVVPANGERKIQFQVTPRNRMPFHQRVTFFLNHSEQFQVDVDVLGSIKEFSQ